MNTTDLFQQLQSRLNQLWQDNSLKNRDEVSKMLHILTERTLNSLNLVTREEFDAQKKILDNTRDLVVELENKLAQLEQTESSKGKGLNQGDIKPEPSEPE